MRFVTTSPRAAPITGLSHVQLLVSDVGASAEWYTRALGLESYVEDIEIGYVALRHRDARLVIVLTAEPDVVPSGAGAPHGVARRQPAPNGPRAPQAVARPAGETLRTWADHLTAVGIDHAGVILENGNPSLQLRDPDGVAIELVAPGEPVATGQPVASGTASTAAPLRPAPKSPG